MLQTRNNYIDNFAQKKSKERYTSASQPLYLFLYSVSDENKNLLDVYVYVFLTNI